jgi:PadR family transcriptional regulator PadR
MIDTWITQLRKGLLEYCVLTVLARRESYGYEIVAELGRFAEFAVTESTVYPILARLRQEKYLKVRDVPSEVGPPRRYFSLTALGKVRLAEMNSYLKKIDFAISQLRATTRKDHDYETDT